MNKEERDEFRRSMLSDGCLLVEATMRFGDESWSNCVWVCGIKRKSQHEIEEEISRATRVLVRVFSGVFHGREDLRDKFNFVDDGAEVKSE